MGSFSIPYATLPPADAAPAIQIVKPPETEEVEATPSSDNVPEEEHEE
jgi:hypothetical protein